MDLDFLRLVARLIFFGLVPGRASGERLAILSSVISTNKISECEGKRQPIAEEVECRADYETQVRQGERC